MNIRHTAFPVILIKSISGFSYCVHYWSNYFDPIKGHHIVGISNAEEACQDIENRINNSISPEPDFSLDIGRKTGVITLMVKEIK